MNFIRILACLSLCLFGCVKENRVAADGDDDGGSSGGAATSSGQNEGGSSGDGDDTVGSSGGDDSVEGGTAGVASVGGGTTGGESGDSSNEAGATGNAGSGANEAGSSGEGGREPPQGRGQGCQNYCDRIEACLLPECNGLGVWFNDDVCDDWCDDSPDFQLASFAQRECSDFNEILLGNSPELTDFCSDEPIPDECDEICIDFNECGFEIETQACLRICRGYEDPMRNCAATAETCFELFECIDETEPEDNINYREVCQGKCFREVECVRNFCADGTLEADDAFRDGYFEQCAQTCIRTRPPVEELLAVFEGMCVDIVGTVRSQNQEIDDRCDNTEDDVCELLCEKAAACEGVTAADCVSDCENWDASNRRCIDNTPREECERMNGCFGDPSGQANCRQFCDHLQGCLLEACPPQIISPTYSDDCTAGCLPEPPSERLTNEYVAYSCRDIRQGVYQENPGLRPICDGGQDFRPTADECIDVCRTSLDACVPGGELQCTALCRTLTRAEYTCVLSDGASCGAIDACLPQ